MPKGLIIIKEILHLLPVLFTAVIMNICAGLYYNIGSRNLSFNRKTLISGIVKAAVVAGMFVGAAYCFEATDLSSLGITPVFIMNSAIVLYAGKAIASLGKILGIETDTGKKSDGVNTWNR